MAQTHFKKLDEESRALHDSWDAIARLVFLVAVLSVLVWAAVSALREAVHVATHALFHAVEHESLWMGGALLLAALTLGGVARALLLRRPGWAEAAGDGMEVALENYHITYVHEGDDPQPRYNKPAFSLALKKAVFTFLTLGTGGSGGLEAPVVLMGESLAAGFSRVMKITSEFELRTYQIAAISAAVSTLLGAPFTAALFATEVAYGDRIIYRKLAYALWAGVIAYLLNNRLRGFRPLFEGPDHAPVYSLAEYGAAAVVAVAVSVPLALGFGRAMVHMQQLVDRLHPRGHAVVTSVLVGAVALALWSGFELRPHTILGMGEETLHGILAGDPELSTWHVLALILVGKLLTTALTLQGGGSAGLLVPSMYLGGVSGALVAVAANATGLVDLDPALFAVVGLGSSLVAVIGVPLSAIALVLEVFGKSFGPPAILAIGVTYLVTLRVKLYANQRMSPDPEGDETGGAVIGAGAPEAAVEADTEEVAPPEAP